MPNFSMLRYDANASTDDSQMIGSAHGDSLRDLLLNHNLNGLLGGTQQVTIGDAAAKATTTEN
jgi:hypothetical protein